MGFLDTIKKGISGAKEDYEKFEKERKESHVKSLKERAAILRGEVKEHRKVRRLERTVSRLEKEKGSSGMTGILSKAGAFGQKLGSATDAFSAFPVEPRRKTRRTERLVSGGIDIGDLGIAPNPDFDFGTRPIQRKEARRKTRKR